MTRIHEIFAEVRPGVNEDYMNWVRVELAVYTPPEKVSSSKYTHTQEQEESSVKRIVNGQQRVNKLNNMKTAA